MQGLISNPKFFYGNDISQRDAEDIGRKAVLIAEATLKELGL